VKWTAVFITDRLPLAPTLASGTIVERSRVELVGRVEVDCDATPSPLRAGWESNLQVSWQVEVRS
jgi:hypothetical protein